MSLSVKLNESIRRAILKSLLADKFEKQSAKLRTESVDFAMSIYKEAFSEADRRKMKALPDGWLPETQTIQAEIGGQYVHLCLAEKQYVRIPSERRGCLLKLESSHPLYDRMMKLNAEEKELGEEKDKLIAEINAVLHSVTTANKLIEIWPEISKTVNAACKTYVTSANLPAPRIDLLNESLGLKKAA